MLRNFALDRPLAVFDLETTGTDTQRDRIVEISVLKLAPGADPEHRTRRLDPEMPIPPEATVVHGIADADVAGQPTFAAIAAGLALHLDGCDLMGFNALRFDVPMLETEFARAGVAFDLDGRRMVDPCRIYHEREKRDLAAAVRFYCDRDHEGAHGAEADVLAALSVLDGMAERYPDLPRDMAGLHALHVDPAAVDRDGKFRRRADGVVVFAFSPNHKGKPVDDVAVEAPGYLRWMIGADFRADTKAVAAEALARAGQAASRAYTN